MSNTKTKRSPMTWVTTAYFAQGLPFVAIAAASALMFKNMGITDTQIAFWTSLIMLPWTLKPLWGPFMEIYKTKKFFVILTQLTIGVMFGLVAFSLSLPDFFVYSIALLAIIAFGGATHDMAVDGVYLNVLSPKQQAMYIGWQGAAYNLAKVLSGGALVYLAGQLEERLGVVSAWTIVMCIYGAIMILVGLYHIKMLPSDAAKTEVATLDEGFARLKDVITTFFQKKYIWLGIVFIILYRFAEGQAIKIAPLFFKADKADGGLGLSTSDIGLAYGVFGAAAYVAGSLAGGYFVSSRGLNTKTLLILCAFFNLPFAMFALLAYFVPSSLVIITGAVVIEYFGYGFGFVGLTLFMMQQIAPGNYKMAHYAFATGIMNLGVMIPSMLSGYLSDMMGYKMFFIWVLIATIPAFLICWFIPLKPVVADENE
ncbi:MAG: MFS transporter [Saprospiraceae bacterium]|jgi:PAT family beta-lactamase induction signal transducer AmpG|nr:MFS transporter [Saprospiraceae bacterium]